MWNRRLKPLRLIFMFFYLNDLKYDCLSMNNCILYAVIPGINCSLNLILNIIFLVNHVLNYDKLTNLLFFS